MNDDSKWRDCPRCKDRTRFRKVIGNVYRCEVCHLRDDALCGWCKEPWHPQEDCEIAQKVLAHWLGGDNPPLLTSTEAKNNARSRNA